MTLPAASRRCCFSGPACSAERKAYADLVAGAHTDWLLAPTQVQLRGFGLATPSAAINAWLAEMFPSTFSTVCLVARFVFV